MIKNKAWAFVAVSALFLTTGCDSPVGQFAGGLVTVNNQPINQFFKGVMDQLNAQQKAQLQQNSPDTYAVIEHNDAVAKQQAAAANQKPGSAAPPAATADDAKPAPLTVDNIKAMIKAGIKSDAIIAEIGESKSRYTQQDIDTLKSGQPDVDAAIIDEMKKTAR